MNVTVTFKRGHAIVSIGQFSITVNRQWAIYFVEGIRA